MLYFILSLTMFREAVAKPSGHYSTILALSQRLQNKDENYQQATVDHETSFLLHKDGCVRRSWSVCRPVR